MGHLCAGVAVHFPLNRAALCLDCDVCFELEAGRGCPACGGDTWIPLARFLERQSMPGRTAIRPAA
jgi:hypothetical protein